MRAVVFTAEARRTQSGMIGMTRRRVIAVLVAVAGIAAACLLFPSRGSKEYSAALAMLSLRAPVTLENVVKYDDGGTVEIALSDSRSSRLQVCLDFQIDSKTPGHIYIGARHPTDPGARHVEPNSDTEKAILLVLQTWLDGQFSAAQQRTIYDRHSIIGLPENEVQALRIMNTIAWLKQPTRPAPQPGPGGKTE